MSNPDDPRTWVAKAENDLLSIRNNLAANQIPCDAVCFHAQQAAEKMLKAFLVSRGRNVRRTHDLIVLLAEAVDAGGPFEALETACRSLSPYAVLFRYPSAQGDPSLQEARESQSAAERVYDAVRSHLDQPSSEE